MLVIRLQRTGRSGHAQFRLVVQDKRFSPSKGRVVAYLGNYDPHTKALTVDGEKASQYMSNGAQPSDRVARLLQKEGVKLPAWVSLSEPKQRTTRKPEKRRSTAPAQPEAPAPAEPEAPAPAVAEEAAAETAAAAAPVEEPAPEAPGETPASEPAEAPEAPDEEA